MNYGRTFVLSSLLVSAVSFGADWTAKSERGKTYSFQVEGALTQTTSVGLICGSEPTVFTYVELWMPQHRHGSTPTTLTTIRDNCARVDRLNFLMAGRWDVRAETAAGDKVSIAVDVP